MIKAIPLLFIAIVMTLASEVSADELQFTVRPILTLDIATKVADACEARQIRDKRPPVSITIFDRGANLVLFHHISGRRADYHW